MISETMTAYFRDGRDEFNEGFLDSYKPLKDYHQNSNEEDENLFFDLIQQMLAYDPDQRLSLTAALKHPFFDKIASSA